MELDWIVGQNRLERAGDVITSYLDAKTDYANGPSYSVNQVTNPDFWVHWRARYNAALPQWWVEGLQTLFKYDTNAVGTVVTAKLKFENVNVELVNVAENPILYIYKHNFGDSIGSEDWTGGTFIAQRTFTVADNGNDIEINLVPGDVVAGGYSRYRFSVKKTVNAEYWPEPGDGYGNRNEHNISADDVKLVLTISGGPPTAPTELLCNGQANPVDVLPAYFSAIYNDPDVGDIAGHYRLQVNKASNFTSQMLWDSGKTAMSNVDEGDRCENIDYNGQALSLNKVKYYWRIKFWDDGGEEGAWSAVANFTMAGSGAGEMGAGPWEEDILYPANGGFGGGEVEIPRRSGNWTSLADMMRIHTSVNKNPLDAVEIAQAEVSCCNISKNFNSFEEASDWYKQLEGYALRLTVGCMVAGTPISRRLFTGIISSVDVSRSSQTAEITIIDFLDYFGRVTIEQTPVWENISLTQLYKNLVELAFSDWVEGVDYFVEDLGDITMQAISYENLNLLAELKHIAECRGMRIFTDVNGKLVCRSRSLEGDPWDIKHDYNLEGVSERRDINNVFNWIIVHARPHEIAYESTGEIDEGGGIILVPDIVPSGKVAAFTATPGFEKIDLTWLNPTGDDFALVNIRVSVSGYPVNVEDGVQIYQGDGEAYTHQPLTTTSRRYYSAFVRDTAGNWSEAAHTSAVPGVGGDTWVDDTGTSPVSAFSGTPGSGQVSLTWRNPDVSNFELVRIRRSTSTYPATPSSGSAVYEGTSETKLDTGLANGTRYYYSAFAKNTAGKWSKAAFGTCIPGGVRKAIGSQTIYGAGCLTKYDGYGKPAVFPTCGFAGSDFSIYKDITFGSGGQTADWLRFKHRWDIQVDASLSWSSNQRHEIGEKADLPLSFSHTIGGIVSVVVTKIGVTNTQVRVRYSATYVGGRAHKISFRNTLTLMG